MATEKRLKGIPNKCDSCVYITACQRACVIFNYPFYDFMIRSAYCGAYEPKENFPKVVVSPLEDDYNNKEMYFKCGMRHMKAMVLAMLQDVLDQADGFCMIDVSVVIKAVEDL
jgi:hypothetical protein